MKRKLKFLMALLFFGGGVVPAQQNFFVSEVATGTCNGMLIMALVRKAGVIYKNLVNSFLTRSLFLSPIMHTYVGEDTRKIQISENTNNNNL